VEIEAIFFFWKYSLELDSHTHAIKKPKLNFFSVRHQTKFRIEATRTDSRLVCYMCKYR